MKFDNEYINKLLSCKKEIVQVPSKIKLEHGHYRIGFEMRSINKEFFFSAFGRFNAMFPENFSVGLVYLPKEERGSFEILRCNGPHGEHRMFPHHIHYHIHKITTDAIDNALKEDSYIEITDKYVKYEDALHFFVKHINLKPDDIEKYFPGENLQFELFNK